MSATHANRQERVQGVIRAGELEVSGENQAEVDAYLAPDFASTDQTEPSSITTPAGILRVDAIRVR